MIFVLPLRAGGADELRAAVPHVLNIITAPGWLEQTRLRLEGPINTKCVVLGHLEELQRGTVPTCATYVEQTICTPNVFRISFIIPGKGGVFIQLPRYATCRQLTVGPACPRPRPWTHQALKGIARVQCGEVREGVPFPCFHCGSAATSITCDGCNFARFCTEFCEQASFAKHRGMCGIIARSVEFLHVVRLERQVAALESRLARSSSGSTGSS